MLLQIVEKMEWIKGLWWGGSGGGGAGSSTKKRERSVRISLEGRDTPIDLVEKASFRIAHIKDALYSVNPDKSYLTVNLPKRKSKTKRKDYVMYLFENLDELMIAIKEEMEFDKITSMDSVRLAAEYPNFFWNGMFHCLGSLSVLDGQMKEHGVCTSTRKRRQVIKNH